MSAFWKNLHRLAQGQLFNGGHLHGNALPAADAKTPEKPVAKNIRSDGPNRCLPHQQIAAYR
jgi:hypothetical protein